MATFYKFIETSQSFPVAKFKPWIGLSLNLLLNGFPRQLCTRNIFFLKTAAFFPQNHLKSFSKAVEIIFI